MHGLCRFFNTVSKEAAGNVGDREVWKAHEKRVEWLIWYWEEYERKRVVRTAREADKMLEWEEKAVEEMNGQVDNKEEIEDVRDGDELTEDEKKMVRALEEEIAKDSEDWFVVDERVSVKNGTKGSRTTKGASDSAAWADNLADGGGPRWWKSQKRKRTYDLD